MFRHVALFRLRPDLSPEARSQVVARLRELPERVDSLRGYDVGLDAGLADDTWDLAVVALFDDEAGYRAYASHPDHLDVITEVVRPAVTERAALQFTC